MYKLSHWHDGQELVYLILDPTGKSIGETYLSDENALARLSTLNRDVPMLPILLRNLYLAWINDDATRDDMDFLICTRCGHQARTMTEQADYGIVHAGPPHGEAIAVICSTCILAEDGIVVEPLADEF